jgi:hypothetical protein
MAGKSYIAGVRRCCREAEIKIMGCDFSVEYAPGIYEDREFDGSHSRDERDITEERKDLLPMIVGSCESTHPTDFKMRFENVAIKLAHFTESECRERWCNLTTRDLRRSGG